MTGLWGEFECKVDAKLRFMFPVRLREQMGDAFNDGLMVTRDINRPILKMYPMKNWTRISKKLSSLNRFNKKIDDLVRRITGGATAVEADSAGRVLLPRPLADWARLGAEIVVFGSNDVIEIWDKKAYLDFYKESPENLDELTEQVFGGVNFGEDAD